MPEALTRRQFTERGIGAVAVFTLLDTLLGRDAFPAAPLGRFGRHWLADLDDLGREVKSEKIKQVEWQKKTEELFAKVQVRDFLKLIRFEELAKKGGYAGQGAKSLTVNFPEIEGVPTKLVFGRQIFSVKKDRSVVPHGHDNMATAFLILEGTFRGRHFDRVGDEPDHMIVVPTLDREFEPGGCSTVSDYKDNVHWFQATSGHGFIFNIHVMGVNPKLGKPPARVYIDPAGDKLEGGKIRARVISHSEADKLYG